MGREERPVERPGAGVGLRALKWKEWGSGGT